MSDYIGLYYPHITFPGDAWVKLAAIYWDRLGRIVPHSIHPQDSDTVRRLQGELGFVKDFEPMMRDTMIVGDLFSEMLLRYKRGYTHHQRLISSMLRKG